MTLSLERAASDAPAIASTLGMSWPLLVAAGGFILGLNDNLLVDADIYWHLAMARWMLEHLAIPTVDTFSHTLSGAPWLAHEWLAELLLAAGYRAFGWAGPVVLTAAAYGATLALLCRYLLRHLEPIYALCLVVLAACLIQGHLVARPHALALPLIAAWAIVLIRAREAGKAPAWYWVFLMTAWSNLHGSFPLGLGLAGFLALEAVFTAPGAGRRQVLVAWSRFILLALLAATLTPHGLAGLAFAAKVHGMSYSMDVISEWRSPDFHEFQPLELALMIGALAVLVRGLSLPPWRILLVLGLLHLALAHARHGELLGLIVPVLVAAPLGAQWRAASNGEEKAEALDRWFIALAAPAQLPAVALTLALLGGVACLTAQLGMQQPSKLITPAAATQAALAAAPGGQVLNSYHFGGYLIFSGIAPFIDGRADLYGDEFLAAYGRAIKLESSDALPRLLERHDIGWTLLTPGLPAVALLDHLPGWRRVYADDIAVVHVRTGHK